MELKGNMRVIFWARIALILFVFVLLLFVIHIASVLFVPLFAALLVAILLQRIAHFLERLHLGVNVSAFLCALLFLVIAASIFLLIYMQLVNFSEDLPATEQKISALITTWQSKMTHAFRINNNYQNNINKSNNTILSTIGSIIGPTLLTTARFLILFTIFLFFTFFILAYRNLLKEFVLSLFQEPEKQKAMNIILTIRSLVDNYLIGIITEMAIVFTLLSVTLMVLGIKYALFMALLAAVINIIPYAGIYVAAIISILITMVHANEYKVIQVAIVFISVHLIDANVLIPYIVGKRVKINPFMALVAMIAGELIWGIPGIFLFVPLIAILRIIFENTKELKPWSILIGEEK